MTNTELCAIAGLSVLSSATRSTAIRRMAHGKTLITSSSQVSSDLPLYALDFEMALQLDTFSWIPNFANEMAC